MYLRIGIQFYTRTLILKQVLAYFRNDYMLTHLFNFQFIIQKIKK
jgi:hypothetical protein